MRHCVFPAFSALILAPAAGIILLLSGGCAGGPLSGFKSDVGAPAPATETPFSFDGYTNHWQGVYRNGYSYGSFIRINVPDAEKTIARARQDIAESLGLPGLRMQEGFFEGLSDGCETLDNPSPEALRDAFRSSDTVLAFVDNDAEIAATLKSKSPCASSSAPLEAFVLKKGRSTLHVALGEKEALETFKAVLADAQAVIGEFDLKRGWFGAETLERSVTCAPGNPIEVMGAGMNEGNSWFVFCGLYEFLLGKQLQQWVDEAGASVVTDLGTNPLYGCDDYEGIQIQEMRLPEDWERFQREKHGYIFRPVPETGLGTGAACDGYFATSGHKRQADTWDKPFVIRTGGMLDGPDNSMVLFVPKGTAFDRKQMWDAIMDRRSVCVENGGVIMGPDRFRRTIQLLTLDRKYLEALFGDRMNMLAEVEGHTLRVNVTNLQDHAADGTFSLQLPDGLSVKGEASRRLRVAPGATEQVAFELLPAEKAMGHPNAVLARFDWGDGSKEVLASVNLPPAVSTHQLLYGPASGCAFPVSVHNITEEGTVPVKVTVKDASGKEVLAEERTLDVAKAANATETFDLILAPGAYTVVAEAMGISAETRLGIGDEAGEVTLREVDLNGDGVNEYVMENDMVRVTLLTTGARVIEYYVKSKDDNVFFKLWPEKPVDDDRYNREWGFYPYGGFEDFLGQASVETHKVYDAEVLKAGGAYAEVRMRADYYGSVIEKTFSLYGGTPLLGIRFALDMVHPEMNILGPQPIIQIGKDHGLEDHFIIPEEDGLHTYLMDPVNYYGKVLYPTEGWNAAQDMKEGVSFVGAFPVRRPYFLHMWMNLPTNGDSHYSYTELQPWLPLYQHNTSYFSYYMWADGTPWEESLKELRNRNLITQR